MVKVLVESNTSSLKETAKKNGIDADKCLALDALRFSNVCGSWKAYVANSDKKSMRDITERDLKCVLAGWPMDSFGGNSQRYVLLAPFTFGTVVELVIEGDTMESYDNYKGVKCNNGRVQLVGGSGRQDSAYGTCMEEHWNTVDKKNDVLLVGDIVDIVLSRFYVKFTPEQARNTFYGQATRVATMEDDDEPTTCFRIQPWLYTYLTCSCDQLEVENENVPK